MLFGVILAIPLAGTIKCCRHGWPLVGGDGEHYYAILRSFVFDGDADLRNALFQLTPRAEENRRRLAIVPETGRIAEKHTVGWAVVSFVPYLCVHACYRLAGWLGYGPAIVTGYEPPYQVAVEFAQIAAGCLGLIFSYRLCRRYFAIWPAMMALASVLFGTALFTYCMDAFMAHASGFCAVSAFLYYCAKLGDATEDKARDWALAGFTAGLMVIVRQTNGLFLLAGFYPLVSRLDKRSGESRFVLIRGLVIAGLTAAPVVALQLLFWHGVFGKWLLFSYGTEEKFFWTRPDLVNYLFSPMRGFVVSSPVIVLAALGLAADRGPAVRSAAAVRGAQSISAALLIYTNSAWHDWTFGCGFGCRSFVNASAPACLGLAAMFSAPDKLVRYAPP